MSESAIDVSGAAEFETVVIKGSSEKVVVVDFWAPWCGPCKVLGPVLEKAVESFGSKAVLVKVNVDENQDLAAQYQVQGIPSVKIFSGGRIADAFTGALPEQEILSILTRAIPSEADETVSRAKQAAENGEIDVAEGMYRKALQGDPDNIAASLGLAEIHLGRGEGEKAGEILSSIELPDSAHDDLKKLYAVLDFAVQCALGNKTSEEKDELGSLYASACCLASKGEYEQSLEQLIEIAQKDLHYNNDASKKAILRIFSIIGQNTELANEYRIKLTNLLY